MEPLKLFGLDRRDFLGRAAFAGAGWMTLLSHMLARGAAPLPREKGAGQKAQSIILLWMQGGPSQLETFDPHPGKKVSGGTKAIKTSVKGIELAEGLEQTAEQMKDIALIRSMVSKEGDHERGTYTLKTGYRPDPTVVHPAIGAVLCHELPGGQAGIPRHVSILPNQWSSRGGSLGDQYDAFRTGDPNSPVPDTVAQVNNRRDQMRMESLDVVEKAFQRGRKPRVEATLHRETVNRARLMMSSEQLAAFNVSKEPLAVRKRFGDTPFGRACLAARRLTEVGVRCVEVTLDGWDTHVNNHSLTKGRLAILDPAFAALVADLRERKRLDSTLVIVMGEFGRTPGINPLEGRDHWPHGFSVALAGGGVVGGKVIGETNPGNTPKEPLKDVKDPVKVGDLHATVLTAVGIDPEKLNKAKLGRTFPYADGQPVKGLLKNA